jgi:3-hydroxy-3-methylglutaryl CoA synthase
MTVGIHAFGAYIPRLRLQRGAIAEANAWFNPALKGLGKGERAMCNWDEDAVTMAVEAARDCLRGFPRERLAGVYLASTSAPFQDRQNAGLVSEALHLGRRLQTLDVSGSQRAGTSALATALQVARGDGGPILVSAGEKRRTMAASPLELTTGDAAAAFVVAEGAGVARLLGRATESVDFVDHYRGQDEAFDYVWEERWARDEGFMKIVPAAVTAALENAGVEARAVDHFCFPCAARRVAGSLARTLGMRDESVRDNLQGSCGEAGAAHPLVMLGHALEEAGPGDVIAVVGFGQGCDALVFEVTDAIAGARPGVGVSGHLARGHTEHDYLRYLGINNLLTMDRGLRSEVDRQTGLTTLYRNKDTVLGLIGGRCTTCGTLQFPKTHTCVNPNCHAVNTQHDHPFADMPATLNSYTADGLTYSPSPPAYYGMVQFAEGGRVMIDFTDVDPGTEIAVGTPMRMVFRIKDFDTRRGFRRYFWKAVPA